MPLTAYAYSHDDTAFLFSINSDMLSLGIIVLTAVFAQPLPTTPAPPRDGATLYTDHDLAEWKPYVTEIPSCVKLSEDPTNQLLKDKCDSFFQAVYNSRLQDCPFPKPRVRRYTFVDQSTGNTNVVRIPF